MNPLARQRKRSRPKLEPEATIKDRWTELLSPCICLLPIIYAVLAFGGVRLQDRAFILACCSLGFAFWIGTAFRSQRGKFDPFLLLFLPLSLYALWWSHAATVIYPTRLEILDVWAGTALFLLAWAFVRSARQRQMVLFVLTSLATIAALWAVVQTYSGKTDIWGATRPLQYGTRGSGPYMNPNHLAGLLELALPMALAYLALARGGVVSKLLLGYAALAMIAGLIATQSRAGIAACLISVILLLGCLLLFKRSRVVSSSMLAILVLLGVTGILGTDQLKSRYQRIVMIAAGKDDESRTRFWPAAYKIWQTSPWIGVGPGHFDFHYQKLGDPHFQGRPDRVHNDYLNTLADWGAVGLTCVLLPLSILAWLALRHLWRNRQQTREGSSRALEENAWVVGILFALLGIALHSLADFNMHIPANAAIVCLLAGILLAIVRPSTTEHPPAGRKSAVLLTICLISPALAMTWWSWFLFQETQLFSRVKSSPVGTGERLARLEAASAFDPLNYHTLLRIAEHHRMQGVTADFEIETPLRKAIQYYEETLLLNPFAWEAHAKMGMCYNMLGEFEPAEENFKRALELNVYSARLMAFYGWHCFQMERYDESENWFRKAQYFTKNQNELAGFYLGQLAIKRAEKSVR